MIKDQLDKIKKIMLYATDEFPVVMEIFMEIGDKEKIDKYAFDKDTGIWMANRIGQLIGGLIKEDKLNDIEDDQTYNR
jgi:hypothetical protein